MPIMPNPLITNSASGPGPASSPISMPSPHFYSPNQSAHPHHAHAPHQQDSHPSSSSHHQHPHHNHGHSSVPQTPTTGVMAPMSGSQHTNASTPNGGMDQMMFMDIGGSAYDALDSILNGSGGQQGPNGMGMGPGGMNGHHLPQDPQDMSALANGVGMGISYAPGQGVKTPYMAEQQHPLSSAVSPGQFFDFDMSGFAAMDTSQGGGSVHGGSTSGKEGIQPGSAPLGRVVSQAGSARSGSGQVKPGEGSHQQPHGTTEEQERLLMDALQAGMLQQQLEQFQLQSPALLANLNGATQNSVSANLLRTLASHGSDSSSAGSSGNSNGQYDGAKHQQQMEHLGKERLLQMAHSMGLLTPAQSGELNADVHTEFVSPLGKDLMYSGDATRNFTPMISPAMTGSFQPSPEFRGNNQAEAGGSGEEQTRDNTQVQLEEIRRQQVEIQRQLDRLQQQTHQSPVGPTPHDHQAYGLPSPMVGAVDPAFRLAHVGRNQGESLTPLTSPALNPWNDRFHHRSNSVSSTLPSPAILAYNPSSNNSQNHAQGQNLPPGYYSQHSPQPNDPQMAEYLANLATLLDQNQNQNAGTSVYQDSQHSGNGGRSALNTPGSELGNPFNHLASPAMIPMTSPQIRKDNKGTVTGPHRSSQGSGRTRPSPMLRPTGRPSRMTPATLQSGQQYSSVPPSPLVSAHVAGTPEMQGVNMRDCAPPPHAFQGEGGVLGESTMSSTSGSLSPVELAPGVVSAPSPEANRPQVGIRSGIAPITPAALMHIAQPIASPRMLPGNGKIISKDYASTGNGRFAVPQVPSGSYRNDGQGSQVLSNKTLEGLKALKAATLDSKAQAAKALTKPNKPAKKLDDDNLPPEVRKTSHKAAEQKRRDSLKASFDELRLLLPPINIDALDPESGEPIPGSSAPRLLPKSSLVPDDNPNKGVSKVALLKFSNDYIARLHTKIERRENYIDLLKEAIRSLRFQAGLDRDAQLDELLDYEFEDEEEDDIAPPTKGKGKDRAGAGDEDEEDEDDGEAEPEAPSKRRNSRKGRASMSGGAKPKAAASRRNTVTRATPRAGSKRNSLAMADGPIAKMDGKEAELDDVEMA